MINNMQRSWAEVNLDAIEHNVKQIKGLLKKDVKLMGVVKADAYGHGFEETASTILKSGADELAVACADEAIQLRKNGFGVPILILGNTSSDMASDLIKYDIMPCVYNTDFAEYLSKEAALQGKTAKIHIKIDTGMGRIGFLYDDSPANRAAAINDILRISMLPNIKIEGMFTHFATSDEADDTYTHMQFERFKNLAAKLEEVGISIPSKHVCNSAAIMRFPEMQLDMVRAGVIMYGMYPSEDVDKSVLDLIPAMSFKTRVIHVKEVDEGSCISYGRTFRAPKRMKIATLAVGYADGYSRLLSGKVDVLVDGQRAKQIGRICMDQCMIDVTNVNNINVGDEVTLFGNAGKDNLPIEYIAEKFGTINYEISCIIGKRIPRIYIKSGRVVKSVNYLLHDYDL